MSLSACYIYLYKVLTEILPAGNSTSVPMIVPNAVTRMGHTKRMTTMIQTVVPAVVLTTPTLPFVLVA